MKRKLAYIFLILLGLYFYTAFSIYNYSKHYVETKADVAIVLGAGTNKGYLSKVFKQRALHGINLLKRKRVNKLIFTGGFGEGQNISDSEAAKRFAIQQGVNPKDILIEESSTLTFYNIKYSKQLMDNHQFSNALLVSDPYHMKRAMKMCSLMELNASPSPTPTTMYRTPKTKCKFLLQEAVNYWAYIIFGQFRSTE